MSTDSGRFDLNLPRYAVAVPSAGDYGVGDRLDIGVDQKACCAARLFEVHAANEQGRAFMAKTPTILICPSGDAAHERLGGAALAMSSRERGLGAQA